MSKQPTRSLAGTLIKSLSLKKSYKIDFFLNIVRQPVICIRYNNSKSKQCERSTLNVILLSFNKVVRSSVILFTREKPFRMHTSKATTYCTAYCNMRSLINATCLRAVKTQMDSFYY